MKQGKRSKISIVRSELGISNTWIAEKMGYASVSSYNKSAGKEFIERTIVGIYEYCNGEIKL